MDNEVNDNTIKTEDQSVTGFVKWLFVCFMMALTVTCFYLIVTNFSKVTNPPEASAEGYQRFLDSLKNAQIRRASSDTAFTNIDSLKKIIADTTQAVPGKVVLGYMKSHPISHQDESEFHKTLMLLVGCTGALGSMIFILSSFVTFWGNRKLERSWLAWYAAKPFIGMGLALLVYLAMRAGFFSSSVGAGDINIYGVLAISGMVGLFTDDATLKLKEIFEVIFKTAKDDRDGKLKEDNNAANAQVAGAANSKVANTTSTQNKDKDNNSSTSSVENKDEIK